MDERAITEGKIDAVVIGRQAIADPDFAGKVVAGKPEEVRICIGCNQGCIWGYFTTGCVGCAVNPEVGHEADRRIAKATERKKVSIVGGGVAGMEAARVARLRGHDVTLYEKSDALGGNLIPSGAHDFKAEVTKLNDYYRNEMKRLCVDVRLNTEMYVDALRNLGADAIILATGSVSVMPRSIKGIDHPRTVSGVDALLERKSVGQKVVIVGGGLVGCEIAFGYAKEGREVTIVEALDGIMKTNNVPGMNKSMLLDAFEHYGTKVLTGARLLEINDTGAVVGLSDGSEMTLEADNVILSIGYTPLPSMVEKLACCDARIYEIGDGRKVGNVMTCVRDAFEVARKL